MDFINRDLETCCGCCSLRTGNFILGTSDAIFTFFILLGLYAAGEDYNPDTGSYEYSAAVILLMIIFLAKFLFSVTFVYAVYKGIPKVVRAYSMTYLFLMGLWAVLATLCILLGEFGLIIWILRNFLFDTYSYMVCRSYYRQLLNQEQSTV